jgi:hypothetical protein
VRKIMQLVNENPDASNEVILNKHSSLFPQSGLVKAELIDMVEYIREGAKRDMSKYVAEEIENLDETINTSKSLID